MVELISIGILTKTHALKGALKMRPFNPHTDFFNYTDHLYVNEEVYIIDRVQSQNGIFILTLKGVNDINEAEKLKGKEVFVDKSCILVDEDEILLSDMIGFKALFKGEVIGELVDFADYNAGFIYVIKNSSDKTFYLPDQEDFVESIDYNDGKIYFKDIEELLE